MKITDGSNQNRNSYSFLTTQTNKHRKELKNLCDKMENSFSRMVNEISNLSTATKGKEFDTNVRGKWNNHLNEMTSMDFGALTVADGNVSVVAVCEISKVLVINVCVTLNLRTENR